jgi:hypothetical protein
MNYSCEQEEKKMNDHFTTEDMIYEYLTRYYDSKDPRRGAEQIANLIRHMYNYMIEISFDNKNNEIFSAEKFVDMVMNNHFEENFSNRTNF